MTALAVRKRLRHGGRAPESSPASRAAAPGRVGAIAGALVALIVVTAAMRLAPELRAWLAAPAGGDAAQLAHIMLFDLAAPRVAAALVAGGCLAAAGALLQSLTRNPLAAPDLLGITGGAQLGLIAAMLVPALAGHASVPLLFVCGLAAAACVSAAAGGWRATPLRLILAGSVCMLLFSAVTTLLLAFFEQTVVGASLWASGSLYQPGVLPWPAVAVLLLAAGAAVLVVGASFGPVWIGPGRWFAALAQRDDLARTVLDLRAPRLLCALLAGALLGASGVLMQSIVRNPLAGPEVLGVTQGAGLATLATLVAWPLAAHGTLVAASLAGGGATLVLTLALNRRHRYAPLAVALTGIVIGTLWTTLAQWLITQESVQPARFVVWLVGGTYGRSWGEAAALLPWGVLAVPALALLARPLDLLALGDEQAAALGLPIAALRPLVLTIATLAACAAVAAVGPVGFIGLMAPHLAAMLGARAHATRLWLAAACGALVLAAADIAARTLLAPREIPAGVLTALIGAPYLLALLIAEARRERRGGR
ncbi:iron chelate uptake ABC transporter family permease subunit [Burkholderia pseudomallei]|uniref:iron chelate uptake ABC transporter family permease subunit n=1 Tax=Burkholderia pseudomallei TaxID=28450 RepID=UPI00050DAE30|nr:iron chelate uptake ABC transporter family permease subunit [Burkholderia pseudomallei]KGD09468.1 fecCD transport family protein [Burkholderia pseudomallei]